MKARSAERYAKALIEVALEAKEQTKVQKELAVFGRMLQTSVDLKDILFKDVFLVSEKEAVLKKLFGKLKASKTTENFLIYLTRQNRFYAFFDIQQDFDQRLNDLEKKGEASVTSAAALSAAFKKKIQKKFETELGKKLEMNYDVDPELLGGVVSRVGNKVYDGSIRTQLNSLEQQLEKGV